VIDTNILLDWLLDRDPVRTGRIDNLFAKTKELHIPDVIIVELAFALEKVYEFPREIVFENVSKVLDEPLFNCNRNLFHAVITAYIEHPALSFVDCCLLRYASLQHGATVWTFDKKLVAQSEDTAQMPR
jgi:predicted nucleic-acid-binding protein